MKEKLKELTKDTAIYGISTILSRFLNFVLVPFYTNVFLPADFGIQNTVYSYIAFFNIIYLYGMDSAYLKFASLKDERNPKSIFSTSFSFVAVTSVLFSGLILLFSNPVSLLMDVPGKYFVLIKYVAAILLLDSLSMIPFAYLRLIRKAKKFALIRTLNIIINVLLNLILILKYKMGIEAVFISNLVSSAFSLAALIPDITKNLNFKIRFDDLKDLLKFGIPYLPAGLASMVIQVIDRPILQKLTDNNTVGIYSANYKLGIFMMLYVSMFQYAWQPFFLNNAKVKDAKEIFSKVLTYFLIAGSIILVLLSLFVDDLVKIQIFHRTLIQKAYWGGLNIVPVVLLAYLFNGIYINFTAGIFIENKTRFIPYITGTGALVNVLFNFILIPVLGITGAALATLASYLVMAVGLYIVSQKFYKIEYDYNRIIKIFAALLISAIIFFNFPMNHILYKIVLFFAFILLLFVLKIININEVKNLGLLFKKKSKSSENEMMNNINDAIN